MGVHTEADDSMGWIYRFILSQLDYTGGAMISDGIANQLDKHKDLIDMWPLGRQY